MDLIEKILLKIEEGMSFEETAVFFSDEIMNAEFSLTRRYRERDLTAPYAISSTGEITTLGDHYKEIDAFINKKLP